MQKLKFRYWLGQIAWTTYDAMAYAVKWTGLHRSRFSGPLFHSRLSRVIRRGLIGLGPTTAEVHGSLLKVPREPYYGPGMLRGTFEPETTAVLEESLHAGDTMVDLGANVGYHTLLAARLVGHEGRVFAFEPHPANCELLEENLSLNNYRNVTVVRAAASDNSGGILMQEGLSPGVSSLYDGPLTADRKLAVRGITLDEYFAALGWPEISVIKMDIEGAETAALRGMTELARRNPELKLIVEFGVDLLVASNSTPQEFFDLLESMGFTRFSNVKNITRELSIPREIPFLVDEWNAGRVNNILCEQLPVATNTAA